MSAITPRRGMLRPISDLPASVSPALVEVEDADGSARRAPFSAGESFPDAAGGYGPVHADDEEWNGTATLAERGWVIDANSFGSSYEIDQTFSPSRLRLWAGPANPSTLRLSMYKPFSFATTTASNLSLTFDMGTLGRGGLTANIDIGFRRVSSFLATTGYIGVVPTQANFGARQWTAIDTSANASTINGSTGTNFGYMHVQRAGGRGLEVFFSPDGSTWQWVAGTPAANTDINNYNAIHFRASISAYAAPFRYWALTNNWIRVNRFFL